MTKAVRWSRRLVGGISFVLLSAVLSGCGISTTASAHVTIQAITVPGLGRVIGDTAGYVLYAYMPDNRGPSKCVNVCAKQWPPLVLGAGDRRPVAGRGVVTALLGTDPRPGGGRQVTYNGWPLYLYRNDAPGVAKGQSVDMGAWFALSVNGAVNRTQAVSAG